MTDIALVQKIATKVRRWAEKENKKLMCPFSNDLCGMCAIAAAELFRQLTKAGVKARISANDEHCFVEVLDAAGRGGLIVDVTATQFGREKIFITRRAKLNLLYDYGFWRVHKKFNSVFDLQTWQTERGWPPHQIAINAG